MRIGTDISVLAEPGRPDSSVLAEHLALADLAEPLGFDSLFVAGAPLHRLLDVAEPVAAPVSYYAAQDDAASHSAPA